MAGEFDLIRRYFSPATHHTLLAGGDDAALIVATSGTEIAVSTDMLVGGRHFDLDAPPERIGYKALAVNLSDMAAMGANPRWATLSIALPSGDEAWVASFARSFLKLAERYDVDLIGGDTTRGPLNICVQIMGEVPAGQALKRSTAQIGDIVWVSGTVGDAALALAHRKGRHTLTPDQLAQAQTRLDLPQPRVALGIALRGVAHSAIDVSDGLAGDLGHIAECSAVKAVIDWPRVPLSAGFEHAREDPTVRACALAGGDDYELCFTAPPHSSEQIARISVQCGLPLTAIGRVEPGAGVEVRDGSGEAIVLARAGFDHFSDADG